MKSEQLAQGNEINEAIKATNEIINFWEGATGFSDSGRARIILSNRTNYTISVSPNAFDVVKAITIAHFKEQLAILENDFNNL